MATGPKEAVILVHGIWMNGMDMGVMKHRLIKAGFDARQFSYHSLERTPLENAVALNAFVKDIDSAVIHFVAHSLGGLIVRHLYHEYPDQKPGRVVTLGTPHRPSRAAQQLAQHAPGRFILGKSLRNGLLGGAPDWKGPAQLGSIAGDLRFGMGMFIPGIAAPNDGTVSVEETRLDGMTDHTVVHATHFGLLFSRDTELAVVSFLKTGRFPDG